MKKKRILAISPHLDDAELGAGGTLSKLAAEGHDVHILGLAIPAKAVPKTTEQQAMEATMYLGIPFDHLHLETTRFVTRHFPEYRQLILEVLIKYREMLKPDLVFTPCSHDFHQDHQVVYQETIRAFRNSSTILGYDFPWDYTTFEANCFIPLELLHIINKQHAIQRYASESLRCKALKPRVVESLARVRGSQCGHDFAEAFEYIRGTYNV